MQLIFISKRAGIRTLFRQKPNKTTCACKGCAHCFFFVADLLRSKLRQAGDEEETAFVPQACNHKEKPKNRWCCKMHRDSLFSRFFFVSASRSDVGGSAIRGLRAKGQSPWRWHKGFYWFWLQVINRKFFGFRLKLWLFIKTLIIHRMKSSFMGGLETAIVSAKIIIDKSYYADKQNINLISIKRW